MTIKQKIKENAFYIKLFIVTATIVTLLFTLRPTTAPQLSTEQRLKKIENRVANLESAMLMQYQEKEREKKRA